MTTFFDPPHLQAICFRLSGTRGILNGLLTGRANWTLEQFMAHPPALGLSEDQVDARRSEIIAFLEDNKLSVDVTGEDATITFSPLAKHPYVEPMPPALVPCKQGQTIICGYAQLHDGAVPITKCLVWDETRGRGRFVIGFAVGGREFRQMPESWMLEDGTERYCNEALAGIRWYTLEREALEYAETLAYPFRVRDMALYGELPEEVVDLEKSPAKVEIHEASPEEEDEQFLSFVA